MSCGSDDPSATDRDVDVYVTIIRALAPEPGDRVPRAEIDELDRVVYAGSLEEDQGISLEVQAALVEELEDFATVRFVDERDEAIDDTDDRAPVLEDGVLMLLGPVPTGRSPSVEVERYVDADDEFGVRVGLERADATWAVAGVETVGP